jgi:cytoskeletal protein CcmA (bactofilin family)
MALFNKEPETSSSPDPTAALAAIRSTQSFDDRNVPLSRKANHRKVSATLHRSSDACTYLDSRTKINGQLSFEGPAQIDGQIDGEIVAQSTLVIGHDALVKAKIKAASVVVAGTVSGEISASERIELQPSAKMSGSLAAPKIAVHEDAVFEGNCTMTPRQRVEQRKVTEIRRVENALRRDFCQMGVVSEAVG